LKYIDAKGAFYEAYNNHRVLHVMRVCCESN